MGIASDAACGRRRASSQCRSPTLHFVRWKMPLLAVLVVSTAAIAVVDPDSGPAPGAVALPRPAHVVVVVLENRAAIDVAGAASTPFINSLSANGAVFTHSFAITHPSLPNYLALFSGSTHGVKNDHCAQQFDGPNLASSLIEAGRTFAGYVQGLPASTSDTCRQGNYDKVLAPWKFFPDVPTSVSRPITAFPRDCARLPDLSFVTPDLAHDMHSGTMQTADRWLRAMSGAMPAGQVATTACSSSRGTRTTMRKAIAS